MGIYAETDVRILAQLGRRLRRQRLRQNVTQEALASSVLSSIGTIKALEAGRGKLSTLVAVMRELQILEQLEDFVAAPEHSPLSIVRAKPERQRARPKVDDEPAPKPREDW